MEQNINATEEAKLAQINKLLSSNSNNEPKVQKPRRLPKLTIKKIAIGFAISILIIGSIYFYYQYQKSQKELERVIKGAQSTQTIDAKRLLENVAKLVVLPQDEEPTIATITDITRLKNQPLFANAKNGDKVLIYALAKKAIIYRESINKIIEVAKVEIGSEAAALKPAPKVSQNQATSASISGKTASPSGR